MEGPLQLKTEVISGVSKINKVTGPDRIKILIEMLSALEDHR